MPLCPWPSTRWSGWLTAPATLVRLPLSLWDMQRRISDCGLWRFCSTVTGTRWRKRVPLTDHTLDGSILHTLDLKDITTANAGSQGHHLLPTVCCLWELQLPGLHCSEGRQRGLSISHSLLERSRGKRSDSKTFFPCLFLRSSSLYFSNSCLISGTNLRFVIAQQTQHCGHH